MTTPLGKLSIDTFLANYWQKKPLLVRDAFPDFRDPISPDELAGLACEEETGARIVLGGDGRPWQLEEGPFAEERFATLPEHHWSLLVQAVDHWVPELSRLRSQFRFLPDWRIDDVMVSFAPDGGGVGPHFDQYDVFLIQGAGKRSWRIGPQCGPEAALRDDTPLSILTEMTTDEEWVLETGDMLYLPPGIAHHGTAIGDCMNYSVGFRAPSFAEILTEVARDRSARFADNERYEDAGFERQKSPGEITATTIEEMRRIIVSNLEDPAVIGEWLGRYATEPKYAEFQREPASFSPSEVRTALASGDALERSLGARLAFVRSADEVTLFADGASYRCWGPLADLAIALCDNERLSPAVVAKVAATDEILSLLVELLSRGVLTLGSLE